jgi:hypothetical protein
MNQKMLSYIDLSDTPHFHPDEEIEVYDSDEEVWYQLSSTAYTVSSLLDAISSGVMESHWVRFATSTAKQYIIHLMNSPIDDALLTHPQMTQERVVALADEGYMTVDALINTDDVVDIGHKTGVGRGVVASISADFVDSFSTASFDSGGVLADLSPKNSFSGWDIHHETGEQIVWKTDGGLKISIASDLSDRIMIQSNTPNSDQHPWFRKGYEIELSVEDDITPNEALEWVYSWLAENELVFEDDLTAVKHIGPATRDYLAIEYGVMSFEELRDFCAKTGEMELVFGKRASEVKQSLETVSDSMTQPS